MMENMKVYVEVTAKFDTDGIMMPVSFIWEDGTVYQIDGSRQRSGALAGRLAGPGSCIQ